MSRIFLKAKDVMVLTGLKKSAAYDEIKTLCEIFNKKKLTISDYCNYHGLDVSDVEKKIKS